MACVCVCARGSLAADNCQLPAMPPNISPNLAMVSRITTKLTKTLRRTEYALTVALAQWPYGLFAEARRPTDGFFFCQQIGLIRKSPSCHIATKILIARRVQIWPFLYRSREFRPLFHCQGTEDGTKPVEEASDVEKGQAASK